jgi:hypothetical protein
MTFLVVEDVVDDMVRVAVSAWPSVDAAGMLCVDVASEEVLLVPIATLRRARQPSDAYPVEVTESVDVASAFAIRARPSDIIETGEIPTAAIDDISASAYEALAASVYQVERATQGAALDTDRERLP